jgi:hypothetical protein
MSNKAIFVTIPRAVVTSVYTSDNNGSQHIGMFSPAGEFNLCCPQGVHDFNQHLESDRMDISLEILRCTRLVRSIPRQASCLRLASFELMEISEEWETGRNYLRIDSD